MRRESGVPGAGDEVSLSRYMDPTAVGVRVPSGEFVMLTKTQLVQAWSQQTGAAHEDWIMDHALHEILNGGISIGGLPEALAELQVTADAVIHIGEKFLAKYAADDSSEEWAPDA